MTAVDLHARGENLDGRLDKGVNFLEVTMRRHLLRTSLVLAVGMVSRAGPIAQTQKTKATPSAESCLASGVLPGTTNLGGYSFSYKSGFRDTTESRCVAWVVTNIPKRPDTPYRWVSLNGDWPFLDAILGVCDTQKDCEKESQSRFEVLDGKPQPLRSSLDWGPNKDTYHEYPQAYQPQPTKTSDNSSVSSGLAGTFIVPGLDAPKNRIVLDMRFMSSYAPARLAAQAAAVPGQVGTAKQSNAGVFTYTVTVNAGPEAVRLVASKEDLTRGFALLWGSASSQGLVTRLRQEPTQLPPFKSTTVVVNAVGEPVFTADVPLELYFNTTRVLAVRAPAYRPRLPGR